MAGPAPPTWLEWLKGHARARPAPRAAPARHTPAARDGAEAAIDQYLASAADYAEDFTHASEVEAAVYLASGVPAGHLGRLADLKSDATEFVLQAYRMRLRDLAWSGQYDGSTTLKRLRADGSWEPLRLPDLEP